VAAVQLGRSFIGVELDPGYMEIARARIAAVPPPLFAE
jgi:DNA modification methylase